MKKIFFLAVLVATAIMTTGCGIGHYGNVVKSGAITPNNSDVVSPASTPAGKPGPQMYSKGYWGIVTEDSPEETAKAQARIIEAQAYADYLRERSAQPMTMSAGLKVGVTNNLDNTMRVSIGNETLPVPPGQTVELTAPQRRIRLSVWKNNGKLWYTGKKYISPYDPPTGTFDGRFFNKVFTLDPK